MPSIDSSMTVGVFKDEPQAQQALTSLKTAGFDQVQFLRPGHPAPHSGGLFSGIKRLFAGDNEGIIGNLTDTGVAEADARYYQQEYEAGRFIITVRAGERKQEALDILRRYGAYDAFKRDPQATTTSAIETDSTAKTTSTSAPAVEQETDAAGDTLLTPPTEDLGETYDRHHLDLNEEQLNVSKQSVQTGEVELHKEVVAEQRTLDVPATHEEVVVKQHAVSDIASDTTPIGQNEDVRVPVTAERVEVTKTPVVTGEVSLEKRVVQEKQRVSDTARREELRVEQEGNAPIHGTPSDRFHYDKQKQNQASKPRAKSRKKR